MKKSKRENSKLRQSRQSALSRGLRGEELQWTPVPQRENNWKQEKSPCAMSWHLQIEQAAQRVPGLVDNEATV